MTSDNDVMESNFSERVATLVEGACDGIFTGPLAVLNPEEHAVNVYSKVHEFDDCVHGLNASGSNELRQLEQGGEIEICRESEISPEMSTPSITDRDERDVLVVENLTGTKTVDTSMCEKKTTGLRIPQPANLHDLLVSDSESDVSDGLGIHEPLDADYGGEEAEMDFSSRNPPFNMGTIRNNWKAEETVHRITDSESSSKLKKNLWARASTFHPIIQPRNDTARLGHVKASSSTNAPPTFSPREYRDLILFSISTNESTETLEEIPVQSENIIVWQNATKVEEDLPEAEIVKSPKEGLASESFGCSVKSSSQENDKDASNGWVELPARKKFQRVPRIGIFERAEDDWTPPFHVAPPHQVNRGKRRSLSASEDWDMELDIQAKNAWDLRVNVESKVLAAPFRRPPGQARLAPLSHVTSMLPRDASMMSHGAVGNKNVLRAFPTPTSPSGWSNRENKGNHALKTRDLWTPKQVNTKSLRSSLGLRRNRQD